MENKPNVDEAPVWEGEELMLLRITGEDRPGLTAWPISCI